MAGMSASSSVSAASDLSNHESDVDSNTELTDENESTQKQTVMSLLYLIEKLIIMMSLFILLWGICRE